MTATLTDVNLDVDLDKQVPCTAGDDCTTPAEWIGTARHRDDSHCETRTACTLHKRLIEMDVAYKEAAGYRYCAAHRALWGRAIWRSL